MGKKDIIPASHDSEVIFDSLVVDMTTWFQRRHRDLGVADARYSGGHEALEVTRYAGAALSEGQHGGEEVKARATLAVTNIHVVRLGPKPNRRSCIILKGCQLKVTFRLVTPGTEDVLL
jgi:hypothetical protein